MTEPIRRHIIRTTSILALYELDITPHQLNAVLDSYINMDINDDNLRVNAFQALCAFDRDRDYDEDQLPTNIMLPTAAEVRMLHTLITGVIENQDELDNLIAVYANEWPTTQIALIDRNILRVAVYEIVYRNVPLKVVINEAVEIAKIFGGDSAPRFVNGVLGAVADSIDDPIDNDHAVDIEPAPDADNATLSDSEEFQA